MQLVDDARCAAVTDLETALEQRRGALLILHHDLSSFAEELVAIAKIGVVAVCQSSFGRFLRANGLEDVRLRICCIVEPDTLCGKRGALRIATALVPLHETLGLVARQICPL